MSRKFYNIQTTNARNVFNGNGVTTVFTTDFAFIAAASLKVTLVSAAGVEAPQVLNTNYTVSGGLNNQGNPDVGSVTMLVAPPIGSRLVVERVESYVQPSTFQRFGGIPIKVVELCLDRLTLLAQQLLELSGRALHYPASESLITSGVLPDNANRAGKYLFFNASTGAPEAAAGTTDATPHNALMVALHNAADAAAARAVLGAVAAADIPTALVPVGGGMDYWGTVAPSGWLFPYGQVVSRTTYAALFAALGTTYNTGGEAGTDFRLPDKRGRASFGKDDMGGVAANRLTASAAGGINGSALGNSGGEQAHALTSGENGPHTHPFTRTTAAGQTGGAATVFSATAGGSNFPTDSAGSGTAHNTVPPGIVCNYIIYAGV